MHESITLVSYHQRHAFIWTAQDKTAATCGACILNPVPYLCDYSSCDGADAGVPRYYDDNHLSETGNRKLIPMFVDIFSSAAMAAKSQGSQ
jgi:hypothetical protein